DDAGREVRLAQPARRIVSLAPHLTELLFAAGAGGQVVGIDAWSDYPPAARGLTVVGDAQRLDLEAVSALRPDLVVAWRSGGNRAQVERLIALGFPVFFSEPTRLDDIATTIERFGVLVATPEVAATAAQTFRTQLDALRSRHASHAPVRVFVEIWDRPLVTVGGGHLVTRVIELCGGRNVFAALGALAPQVSVEAVLAANPQMIVAAGLTVSRPAWRDDWRRWPGIAAVSGGHLYEVPPELLVRHTPRILQGASLLCGYLQQVRGESHDPGRNGGNGQARNPMRY
ncbi:MAG: cobalamin-binding protein, partial [Pseudomonadota bacterium]